MISGWVVARSAKYALNHPPTTSRALAPNAMLTALDRLILSHTAPSLFLCSPQDRRRLIGINDIDEDAGRKLKAGRNGYFRNDLYVPVVVAVLILILDGRGVDEKIEVWVVQVPLDAP